MSLWGKFTKPLPIANKWSVLIRCVMYGWPLLVLGLFAISTCDHISRYQKRSLALAVCFELDEAVQRFHDDNGALPIDASSDETIDSNSAEGLMMLNLLYGDGEMGKGMSVRQPNYLNIKQGQNGVDGLFLSADGSEVMGLRDPWGGSYKIRLDGNDDEEIEVQPKAQKEPRKLQRRVAVWSDGKDSDDPKDDVTTW